MRLALLLLVPLLAPQEIAWKTDFKAALKEAAASKKLVVLVFFNKGVKTCIKYQDETLASPDVQAALGKFLCVRIDPDGTDDENWLWQQHKQPPLPMTFVYEPDGKQLATVGSLNPKVYGGTLTAIVPAYFEKIVPAREALAKDPKQPDPHVALGEAFLAIDDSKASAKHYAEAAELLAAQDKAKALALLIGQLDKYYEKKWYTPARACCGRIAELDPDNKSGKRAFAAWVLGMASCAEGRWGEAIDGLKAALEKYKGDELQPKMMFTLGSAYMYAKDIDAAIATFDEIVKNYDGTEPADLANTQSQKLKAQKAKAAEGK